MSKNLNWHAVLTIFILILLIISIVMTVKLLINICQSPQDSGQRDTPPCRALPAQFVIEEPDCADKLLRLMNIANVNILPAEDFEPLPNETPSGWRIESAAKK